MSDGPMAERQRAGATGWGSRIVTGACLGALALLLTLKGVEEARQSRGIGKGTPAPELRAEKYGGGELALSDLRGKVVMLDFWATWCPPCVQEMPTLVKLAREYESRGLVFVAAANDNPVAVGSFVSNNLGGLPSNAHVLFPSEETFKSYRVVSLPTLYFIDREGRVIAAASGFAAEPVLRSRIEHALAQ